MHPRSHLASSLTGLKYKQWSNFVLCACFLFKSRLLTVFDFSISLESMRQE